MKIQNRSYFAGDNLPSLRGIADNSIHLSATDPPFNKSRNFYRSANGAGFRDTWIWERDVKPSWIDQIRANQTALWAVIEAARLIYDDGMSACLCWLAIRLLEMHRVLRDDGSLYPHIDASAHAPVKLALDAIFGGVSKR